MSSYPMYDTLEIGDNKSVNTLNVAYAKIISRINELEITQENNKIYSGSMKSQINKLIESSRFDGTETDYIGQQLKKIQSLADNFESYKGSDEEAKVLDEINQLTIAKNNIEKQLNSHQQYIKTDSFEVKIYFHEHSFPYEKFEELINKAHDKFPDIGDIACYKLGDKGYESASFGYLYDPKNPDTANGIIGELVNLVQQEHIRIQNEKENELFRQADDDVPMMVLNGNTNVVKELLEGATFTETVENKALQYYGRPQRMLPHFKLEGTTELSKQYVDFYERSWLGFDDYQTHALNSAKAFVEENKGLEPLADKVIKKAKELHAEQSNEHSL